MLRAAIMFMYLALIFALVATSIACIVIGLYTVARGGNYQTWFWLAVASGFAGYKAIQYFNKVSREVMEEM